jgi:hypothetical protein
MEEIIWWIGQGFGVIAIALGFLSYQMKTQRGVILAQTATAVVFVIHFALIGAWTGMAMNIVSAIRSIAYYYRNKKGSHDVVIPLIFTVIMAASGILTWTGWYSVFMLLGLVINTVCMSLYDADKVRKSILVSCPLVIIYDIFVLSYSGIVYESVAMVSAAVGLIRYYKRKNEDKECSEQ